MAQATTILGMPLIAVVMFMLANDSKLMGEFEHSPDNYISIGI